MIMDEPSKRNPRFYVTVSEAAQILGYSRQAVLQLIQRNRLRAIKFGVAGGYGKAAVYLIRKDDVTKYLPMRHLQARLRKKPLSQGTA
jgi:excisionase family DNA binding protein